MDKALDPHDRAAHGIIAVAECAMRAERRRTRDCETSAEDYQSLPQDTDVMTRAIAAGDFLATTEAAHHRFMETVSRAAFDLVEKMGVTPEMIFGDTPENVVGMALDKSNGELMRMVRDEDGEVHPEPVDLSSQLFEPERDTTPVGESTIEGIDLSILAPDRELPPHPDGSDGC